MRFCLKMIDLQGTQLTGLGRLGRGLTTEDVSVGSGFESEVQVFSALQSLYCIKLKI